MRALIRSSRRRRRLRPSGKRLFGNASDWFGRLRPRRDRTPAPNARKLASTPVPPARTAASNASRGNGSTPAAASAPNIVADMTLPFAFAIASMSKAMRCLAANSGGRRDDLGIGDAVAWRLFLDDGEGAMGGGDQRRALGRHQPAQHRAAGLHQLRGQHDVDVAWRRHQREHRIGAVARRRHLDVVDRRAGALRDAGHGSRLRRVALQLRRARRSNPRARRRPGRPSRGWRRSGVAPPPQWRAARAARSRRFPE